MKIDEKNMFLLSSDSGLLGMSDVEVESFFGDPDVIDRDRGDTDLMILTHMPGDEEEWIYFLYRSRWGLFSKKLHIYFSEGRVVNHYIHKYIMGLCIL